MMHYTFTEFSSFVDFRKACLRTGGLGMAQLGLLGMFRANLCLYLATIQIFPFGGEVSSGDLVFREFSPWG